MRATARRIGNVKEPMQQETTDADWHDTVNDAVFREMRIVQGDFDEAKFNCDINKM